MLEHTSLGASASTRVHLDIVEEGAAFRITCIDAHERCVEVYDSRSGSWTIFQAGSGEASLDSYVWTYGRGQSVVLLGNVYFAAVSATKTETIVSFNLEDRKWRPVYNFGAAAGAAGCDLRGYNPLQLVTCDEKLIAVLLKHEGGGGVVLSLDMKCNLLVHETSVPKRFGSRMVCEKAWAAWPMVGQGNYLCSFNPKDGRLVSYEGLLPLPETRN